MTLAAGIVTLLLAADDARALVLAALMEGNEPDRRVELVDIRLGLEKGCTPVRIKTDEAARVSGVVGLGVEGTAARGRCQGRGWARVRVYGPVWVTSRAVRGGDELGGAVVRAERELGATTAPLPGLDPGARASTSLSKGLVLEARHVLGDGPAAGARVTVVVELGAIHLEQEGVALSCTRPCARLANGHRVEGALVDGKLRVTP